MVFWYSQSYVIKLCYKPYTKGENKDSWPSYVTSLVDLSGIKDVVGGIWTHDHWIPFRCSNRLNYYAMSLTRTQSDIYTWYIYIYIYIYIDIDIYICIMYAYRHPYFVCICASIKLTHAIFRLAVISEREPFARLKAINYFRKKLHLRCQMHFRML